jgi:hypothetical protein
VLAVDPVVLVLAHGNGSICSGFVDQGDLDLRVRQRVAVPGPGPVVGRDVEVATALEPGEDPIGRVAIRIRRRDETSVASFVGCRMPIMDSKATTMPT